MEIAGQHASNDQLPHWKFPAPPCSTATTAAHIVKTGALRDRLRAVGAYLP